MPVTIRKLSQYCGRSRRMRGCPDRHAFCISWHNVAPLTRRTNFVRIIERIFDVSGSRRVLIFQREDGSFGFDEERFSREPLEMSWIPRGYDSRCDTRERALSEAMGRVEWLESEMITTRILEDADIFAEIALLRTDEGGRQGATPADYFGCPVRVHSEYFDARIYISNDGPLLPGETARAPMRFLRPDLILPLLEVGSEFELWDGRINRFWKGASDLSSANLLSFSKRVTPAR